jgi:ABC-type Zn uptake system ZnuABC Zn-binding protein ZnuA
MKRLPLILGLLLLPALARAETAVLTAHPVTGGLAQALLRDTGVAVLTAMPARLPMNRQRSYFTGRGAAGLAKAAAAAEVVVTLRSVWPDDPLYPLARRTNIRLIEVDAARPVDGALPGLAVAPGDTAPWLAPTNAGRMAGILAADLRRLYPAAADRIDANLAALRRALRQVATDALGLFARLPDTGVVTLSDRFSALSADLGLDVRTTVQWQGRTPSADQLAALTERLRSEEARVVLHHLQPPEAVTAAIQAGGARLAVLDPLDAGPSADLPAALAADIAILAAAFDSQPLP